MINLTHTKKGYVYLYVVHWHTVQDNMFYTENGTVNIVFIDRPWYCNFSDIYQKQGSGQSL